MDTMPNSPSTCWHVAASGRTRRRLVAASQAVEWLCGISRVSRACGLSRVTLIKGVEELQPPAAPGRIRHEGGGRHALTSNIPLGPRLDGMSTHGARDRVAPARTCKRPARWRGTDARTTGEPHQSHPTPAEGGTAAGQPQDRGGGKIIPIATRQSGISTARQTRFAGGRAPYFRWTRRRGLIGNYQNQGRQWRQTGTAEGQRTCFPSEVPRTYPYGSTNGAHTPLRQRGQDHARRFAVASIAAGGAPRARLYLRARQLLITAMARCNGWRLRLWKWSCSAWPTRPL